MKTITSMAATCIVAITLTGCASTGSSHNNAAASAPAPATQTANTQSVQTTQPAQAAPAPSAAPAASSTPQKVKGINNRDGYVSGTPASDSAFNKLKVGMPMKQVLDLIGEPSDQGAYVTGKAWIPFYFGSDRYRHELVYEKQGRLIFAGGSGFNTRSTLTGIIHDASQSRYR